MILFTNRHAVSTDAAELDFIGFMIRFLVRHIYIAVTQFSVFITINPGVSSGTPGPTSNIKVFGKMMMMMMITSNPHA